MSELIQKSGASSASDTYEAYCAGSLGRASASSSMPFVLPDSDEEDRQGGGDPQGENLADQYDLMRHLGRDRSVGGSGEDSDAGTTSSAVSPAMDDTTSADTPSLSSSRAFFSQMTNVRSCAQPATSAAEKLSTSATPTATNGAKDTTQVPSGYTHLSTGERVAEYTATNGTIAACTASDMPRTSDTTVTPLTGSESGLVGSIRVMESGASGSFANRRENEKRDERRNETDTTSNAGAVAVLDESGTTTSNTPQGDEVKLPRMQQISEAILEEMERMSANTNNSSVSLKLDMADGSKLNLRLRWSGSRVKASFDSDTARDLRGEIENGWGSLALTVGNSGIQLDPPRFA